MLLLANVAVTVGVISVLVIIVAACTFFLLGLNVGLLRDANGLIAGVKELFLEENDNRDFFFFNFSSPSSSSSLSAELFDDKSSDNDD